MFPLVIREIECEDDRQFAEQLYCDYKRLMFSEIHKVVKNTWDAEDVLQTSLIKLMGQLALLRTLSRPHLVNYIITVCRNTAVSLCRKQKQISSYSFDEAFDSLDENQAADIQPTMEDKLIEEADREMFYRIWCDLPKETRELLNAKYVLRQSDQMIAETLGIKKDSVRMALTRAKRTFREKIHSQK